MFAGDTLVALHPTPLAEGGRLGEIPVIWEGQLLWVASAPPPETALASAKGVPLAVWRWGPGDDDPTVVFTLPGTEEWKSSKRNAILVPRKDKKFWLVFPFGQDGQEVWLLSASGSLKGTYPMGAFADPGPLDPEMERYFEARLKEFMQKAEARLASDATKPPRKITRSEVETIIERRWLNSASANGNDLVLSVWPTVGDPQVVLVPAGGGEVRCLTVPPSLTQKLHPPTRSLQILSTERELWLGPLGYFLWDELWPLLFTEQQESASSSPPADPPSNPGKDNR